MTTSSPLESLLEACAEGTPSRSAHLAAFSRLPDWEALVWWLGLEKGTAAPRREPVMARLATEIAILDELIGAQVDAILGHPHVSTLEARWRGLRALVDVVDLEQENVSIRLLVVGWAELSRDVGRVIEFDQSQLFDKVYSREFGMPGGEPFGVLLCDYAVSHSSHGPSGHDDSHTLRALSQIGAAAFCPLILGAHPSLFGLDTFAGFQRSTDFSRVFRGLEYQGWDALRRQDEARFLGIVLPGVLARPPWADSNRRADGFRYQQRRHDPDRPAHLFSSAVFAFGQVLIRSFVENGWLANIRGVVRDQEGGGLVPPWSAEYFQLDPAAGISKGIVEIRFTDRQEKELSELGFIPLSHCHGTDRAAFYSNQSVKEWASSGQRSKAGSLEETNAKLATMLQYVFCVSRFTHYIKVIAREKVGSQSRPEDIERLLNDWLTDYAIANESASLEKRASHPLREARVMIEELPGMDGFYKGVIHLRPHYQLDQVIASAPIVTELFAGKSI